VCTPPLPSPVGCMPAFWYQLTQVVADSPGGRKTGVVVVVIVFFFYYALWYKLDCREYSWQRRIIDIATAAAGVICHKRDCITVCYEPKSRQRHSAPLPTHQSRRKLISKSFLPCYTMLVQYVSSCVCLCVYWNSCMNWAGFLVCTFPSTFPTLHFKDIMVSLKTSCIT